MREIEDNEDLRLAVAMLRALRGWSQAELAEAAGVGTRTVSRYESGAQTPSWGTFEQIVAAVGVPILMVDGLLSWISMARSALDGGSGSGISDPVAQATAELTHAIRQLVRSALEESDLLNPDRPGEPDRRNAAELWAVLEPYPLKDQIFLVEAASEYQRWALCELICDKSLVATADQPERAVELAELAVRVAELTPGGEGWKQRTRGYALAHLAEAHRAASDLATARDLMERARILWDAGKLADPGLYDGDRMADLAARLPETQQ